MLNKDHVSPESIIDALNRKKQERQQQEEKFFELEKEWKEVMARLGAIPDFQFFLKGLIRYSGVFRNDVVGDAMSMVRQAGRRDIYLTVVRPYLDPTTKQKVE